MPLTLRGIQSAIHSKNLTVVSYTGNCFCLPKSYSFFVFFQFTRVKTETTKPQLLSIYRLRVENWMVNSSEFRSLFIVTEYSLFHRIKTIKSTCTILCTKIAPTWMKIPRNCSILSLIHRKRIIKQNIPTLGKSICVFSIFIDNATQDDELREYRCADIAVSIVELQLHYAATCSGSPQKSSFDSVYLYDFMWIELDTHLCVCYWYFSITSAFPILRTMKQILLIRCESCRHLLDCQTYFASFYYSLACFLFHCTRANR